MQAYSKALGFLLDTPVTPDVVEAVFPFVAIHRSDPHPKGKFETQFSGNDELGFWKWFAQESKRKLPERKAMVKGWSDVMKSNDPDVLRNFKGKIEYAAKSDMFYRDLVEDMDYRIIAAEKRLR
jgi:hypothetical protein